MPAELLLELLLDVSVVRRRLAGRLASVTPVVPNSAAKYRDSDAKSVVRVVSKQRPPAFTVTLSGTAATLPDARTAVVFCARVLNPLAFLARAHVRPPSNA